MSVCLFLLLELEPGFVLVYPVHFLLTLLLSFYVFVDIVNGRFFFFWLHFLIVYCSYTWELLIFIHWFLTGRETCCLPVFSLVGLCQRCVWPNLRLFNFLLDLGHSSSLSFPAVVAWSLGKEWQAQWAPCQPPPKDGRVMEQMPT